MPAVAKEPKPGYKTTEFWLSVSACILGAMIALTDECSAMRMLGMGMISLAALGYTVSRFVIKK
jgi:hypothetical protein